MAAGPSTSTKYEASICDVCGKLADPEVEYCTRLTCNRTYCGDDLFQSTYHQECIERHLRAEGHDKQRLTGFACPRGCGKGTKFTEKCSGRIQVSHQMVPGSSKKRAKALANQQAILAAAKLPPAAIRAPKPQQPRVPQPNVANPARPRADISSAAMKAQVEQKRAQLAQNVGSSVANRLGVSGVRPGGGNNNTNNNNYSYISASAHQGGIPGSTGDTGASAIPGAEFVPAKPKNKKAKQRAAAAAAAAATAGGAAGGSRGAATAGAGLAASSSSSSLQQLPTLKSEMDLDKYNEMLRRMYGNLEASDGDDDDAASTVYGSEPGTVSTAPAAFGGAAGAAWGGAADADEVAQQLLLLEAMAGSFGDLAPYGTPGASGEVTAAAAAGVELDHEGLPVIDFSVFDLVSEQGQNEAFMYLVDLCAAIGLDGESKFDVLWARLESATATQRQQQHLLLYGGEEGVAVSDAGAATGDVYGLGAGDVYAGTTAGDAYAGATGGHHSGMAAAHYHVQEQHQEAVALPVPQPVVSNGVAAPAAPAYVHTQAFCQPLAPVAAAAAAYVPMPVPVPAAINVAPVAAGIYVAAYAQAAPSQPFTTAYAPAALLSTASISAPAPSGAGVVAPVAPVGYAVASGVAGVVVSGSHAAARNGVVVGEVADDDDDVDDLLALCLG